MGVDFGLLTPLVPSSLIQRTELSATRSPTSHSAHGISPVPAPIVLNSLGSYITGHGLSNEIQHLSPRPSEVADRLSPDPATENDTNLPINGWRYVLRSFAQIFTNYLDDEVYTPSNRFAVLDEPENAAFVAAGMRHDTSAEGDDGLVAWDVAAVQRAA